MKKLLHQIILCFIVLLFVPISVKAQEVQDSFIHCLKSTPENDYKNTEGLYIVNDCDNNKKHLVSTSDSYRTNLLKGKKYTFSFTHLSNIPDKKTDEKQYYVVWIDYNENGNFKEKGEQVYSKIRENNSSYSEDFEITIPNNAFIGKRKIRVALMRITDTYPLSDPTSAYIKDYEVNIVQNPINTIAAPENLQLKKTSDGQFISVIWDAPKQHQNIESYTTSLTVYQEDGTQINSDILEQKGIDTKIENFTISNAPNQPITFEGSQKKLVKKNDRGYFAMYKYQVFAINTDGFTSKKKVVEFINNDYCTPVNNTSNTKEQLTKVTLNTINDTSSDLSTSKLNSIWPSTSLHKKIGYKLDIGLRLSKPIEKEHAKPISVSAWIDYNKDGNFTTEELVWSLKENKHLSNTETIISGAFTVPSNAKSGITTMRISTVTFDKEFPRLDCSNLVTTGALIKDFLVNIKQEDSSLELSAPINLTHRFPNYLIGKDQKNILRKKVILTWEKSVSSGQDPNAVTYDVFRDGLFVSNTNETFFSDALPDNDTHNYTIRSKQEGTPYLSAESNSIKVNSYHLPKRKKAKDVTNNEGLRRRILIENVTVNGINQTTEKSDYSDFTSVTTTLSKKGETTISILPKSNKINDPLDNSTNDSGYVSVYIDYNNDADFDDPSEHLFTKKHGLNEPLTHKFQVPNTALNDSLTVMRVIVQEHPETKHYIKSGVDGPPANGEIEDYAIDFIDKDVTAPTAPSNLNVVSNNYTNASLSWNASKDNIAVTEYEIFQDGKSIGTTSSLNYEVSNLKPYTSYIFIVKAKDAEGNSNSSEAKKVITETMPSVSSISSENITAKSVILSWNPASHPRFATPPGMKYKLYRDGTFISAINSSTKNNMAIKYTVTGLESQTNYNFTVRTVDEAGNISEPSPVKSIKTTKPEYCHSRSYYVKSAYIVKLQLGYYTNSSGKSNYSDYTNRMPITLTKGDFHNLTITPGFEGASSYPEGYAVWIDYNNDGDFNDPGENIYSEGVTYKTKLSTTFKVPSSARTITTRMRVAMKWKGIPSSCEYFSYGEVEDYTVNIVPSDRNPYCESKGRSVVDEAIGNVYLAKVDDKLSYKFVWKGYYYSYEIVKEEVKTTILNNSSGYQKYSNFTWINPPTLNRGQKYYIQVSPQWTGTIYSEGYSVWIDYYDRNGAFDYSERVFLKYPTRDRSVGGYFTIPYFAQPGYTRMRVSMKYNGVPSACETFSYGEVEDYTVYINNNQMLAKGTSEEKKDDKKDKVDTPLDNNGKITLYPNPVANRLFINSNFSQKTTYTISNATGKTVLSGILRKQEINVSRLGKGLYIIRFTDGKSVFIKKFIKK